MLGTICLPWSDVMLDVFGIDTDVSDEMNGLIFLCMGTGFSCTLWLFFMVDQCPSSRS